MEDTNKKKENRISLICDMRHINKKHAMSLFLRYFRLYLE